MTCTMALTTLSMVLTVLVLNLHELSDRPVPRWAHLVFLHYLSRLFCQRSAPSAAPGRRASVSTDDRARPRATVVRTNSPTSPDKPLLPAGRVYADGGFKRSGSGQVDGEVNGNVGSVLAGPRESGYIVWEKHRERRTTTSSVSSAKTKADYSADWHWLATVVDRLFFWSFLVTLIAISVFLFHPLVRIQWTGDGTEGSWEKQ